MNTITTSKHVTVTVNKWVGKNSGPGDQGTHGNPTLLGILYTSLYSILVLGTFASNLARSIHFFSLHSVLHDV